MGRRGDRRLSEGDESGCPSDKTQPTKKPAVEAGRDNDTDHNGTSSQLPKDLGRSSCGVCLLWQSGGVCGTMMR